MQGTVEVEVTVLPELVSRLEAKRQAVQQELLSLGSSSTEIGELLRLCRGFERAFTTSIKSLETAFYIKEAFLGDQGLAGKLRKLPVDKKFRLDIIKAIVREADGFQPHLVSPEKGLRRLVDESIQLSLEPVEECVERVHLLLVNAARDASKKAISTLSEAEIADLKAARFPGFENAVMSAATQALDDWKKEAMLVAKALVGMESDYITSTFFRRAIANRQAHLEQTSHVEPEEPAAEAKSEEEDAEDEDESSDDDEDEEDQDSRPVQAARNNAIGDFTATELKAGYLEKRIGEHSGRGAIPMESWKWQKRWFIFTESKGMLYYFKSPDDPPNYRGAINIRETTVEDIDANGMPKASAAKSKMDLDGGAGTVSLLIRISNKDLKKPLIKKHSSIILRAPSAAEKYEWLARLRHAADPAQVTSRRMISGTSKQYTRASTTAAPHGRKAAIEEHDEHEGDAGHKHTNPAVSPLSIGGRDTFNIGIGTAVPFYDTAKALAPIPPWKYIDANSDHGSRYDLYLQQLGQDCSEYSRVVLDTISTEVPKSIVHCMVKRCHDKMLEQLYSAMTKMNTWEVETIMAEDPEVSQRRAAAESSVADLDRWLIETHAQQGKGGSSGRVTVPRAAVDAADMWGMVQRPTSAEPAAPYGDFTPRALAHTTSGGRPSSGRTASSQGSSNSPPLPSPPVRASSPSMAAARPTTPPLGVSVAIPAAPVGGPPAPSPGARPRRRAPPPPPPAPPAS